ncbi:Ras and EF-hand domain-containing protein [Amphibalanus amphitrite]|uniref:Ras and EF-hand domain-containing protein n=1 Tax=Amphibalanus amphitrite TaxID=1232801 RepID=A0A6A4WI40_AMPAM|nr:Ras and EF-hand domain-containing protein [Amphibalanus amphitrite]
MNLTETETSIALMRADMAQIRAQYEEKCRELHNERQQMEEYIARQDQIQRQLQVLQEANRRIQDTNDSLRQTLQDSGRLRRRHQQRPASQMSSTLGDELDSLWDGESVRSQGSGRRPLLEDVQYGIPRLMHDLDGSLKDPDDMDSGLDRSVRDETESCPGRSVREELDDLEAQQDNGIDECFLRGASPRVLRRQLPASTTGTPGGTGTAPMSAALYEPTGPPDRTYKVVFAGDAAVGKSTFITRICKGVFVTDISSTLGVDFQVKTLCVDEKNVAVQLWDTAGKSELSCSSA